MAARRGSGLWQAGWRLCCHMNHVTAQHPPCDVMPCTCCRRMGGNGKEILKAVPLGPAAGAPPTGQTLETEVFASRTAKNHLHGADKA